jgi:hypothetical protein
MFNNKYPVANATPPFAKRGIKRQDFLYGRQSGKVRQRRNAPRRKRTDKLSLHKLLCCGLTPAAVD